MLDTIRYQNAPFGINKKIAQRRQSLQLLKIQEIESITKTLITEVYIICQNLPPEHYKEEAGIFPVIFRFPT
jgi:hypothetical protein